MRDDIFSAPLPAAPGSGAAITLFDSASLVAGFGPQTRKIIANIRTSHISGAGGLEFQVTWDGGLTWNDIVSYTVPALTAGVPFSSYEVAANGLPRWRIQYTNSSNVLTTWQGNIEAIFDERAAS
jgi:hypothetical protein